MPAGHGDMDKGSHAESIMNFVRSRRELQRYHKLYGGPLPEGCDDLLIDLCLYFMNCPSWLHKHGQQIHRDAQQGSQRHANLRQSRFTDFKRASVIPKICME